MTVSKTEWELEGEGETSFLSFPFSSLLAPPLPFPPLFFSPLAFLFSFSKKVQNLRHLNTDGKDPDHRRYGGRRPERG